MTKDYKVEYSIEALNDLREIYLYIARELCVPDTATTQIKRIRKNIRSLQSMPSRHVLVEWEPWHSMGMRQLPVDNYVVYYLVVEKDMTVSIARIVYGGRDIKGIIDPYDKM